MTTPTTLGNQTVCPVCTVKITHLLGRDQVTFSTGANSTREDLWQRVCQHVQDRPGCINKPDRRTP
ncbi:hypothetical protein IQ266_20735 [filamentous cyanobacterium LEGE 11480]|uniref:Uncharacterized protein n=1 Tax=Romeriopsis navalis LEGE 11480 TaxID=2777977 RepID=A0A928VU89_9CYAN|nr:hypothetical protein [Romeriopsis navalis]MBE9032169.1 hypothetical protein [Romeriopsis navalis LEGE 11480]